MKKKGSSNSNIFNLMNTADICRVFSILLGGREISSRRSIKLEEIAFIFRR
jgi:hypothetical protein